MHDYTEFDAALLALLTGGIREYMRLAVRLGNQAMVFCTKPGQEPFRVVDRRLQALRKQGVIAFNTKTGWNLVKK